jgi:AraC-like DNA-binding protein
MENPAKMISISDELKEKAKLAKQILGSRIKDPPTIAELAKLCMSNPNSLHIAFKAVFSQSINEFSKEMRMERAKFLLVNSKCDLDEIADETGYRDKTSFYRYFKKHVGITPGEFRKKEGGEIM